MMKWKDFMFCVKIAWRKDYDQCFLDETPEKRKSLLHWLDVIAFICAFSIVLSTIIGIILKDVLINGVVDFCVAFLVISLSYYVAYLLFNLKIGKRLDNFIIIKKEEMLKEKNEKATRKAAKKANPWS